MSRTVEVDIGGIWVPAREHPSELRKLCELRQRVDLAYQLMMNAVEIMYRFAPPAADADLRPAMRETQSGIVGSIDRQIALLLRPTCICGWPWSESEECEGCGEARAPDGRSVQTSVAEMDATAKGREVG